MRGEQGSTQRNSALAEGIDIALRSLAGMVDDLRQDEQLWAEMESAEAATWTMDWFQLMNSYIPRLEQQFLANELTPRQARRYQQLRSAVQALWPTIERRELAHPPIPRA